MVREARAAYQRRDREMAARRNDSSIPNGEATKKGERSWWETPGQDGAMSPVNEEISNPMEDVVVSDGEGNQELGSDEDATSGSEFWRSLEKPVFVEHHEDDNRT